MHRSPSIFEDHAVEPGKIQSRVHRVARGRRITQLVDDPLRRDARRGLLIEEVEDERDVPLGGRSLEDEDVWVVRLEPSHRRGRQSSDRTPQADELSVVLDEPMAIGRVEGIDVHVRLVLRTDLITLVDAGNARDGEEKS